MQTCVNRGLDLAEGLEFIWYFNVFLFESTDYNKGRLCPA